MRQADDPEFLRAMVDLAYSGRCTTASSRSRRCASSNAASSKQVPPGGRGARHVCVCAPRRRRTATTTRVSERLVAKTEHVYVATDYLGRNTDPAEAQEEVPPRAAPACAWAPLCGSRPRFRPSLYNGRRGTVVSEAKEGKVWVRFGDKPNEARVGASTASWYGTHRRERRVRPLVAPPDPLALSWARTAQ